MPTSRTHSSAQRSAAPKKVALASRATVELTGLHSVQGAHTIIKEISSRPSVKKLILGHNEFGDDGCRILFDYLSTHRQKHPIEELSLNSCGIRNVGLASVVNYLKHNTTLKSIFLQNNPFAPDTDLFISLALAVNDSQLSVLNLCANPSLYNTFIKTFLPHLDSPHLRELHLSACNFGPESGPPIVGFISSRRCRLRVLKLNGNALGRRATRNIVRAVDERNYTLVKVELLANNILNEESSFSENESDDAQPNIDPWKAQSAILTRATTRNEVRERQTGREARSLLRHARPILFARPSLADVDVPLLTNKPSLPVELQLHVLSFFAPTLSASQRIRVYEYASSPKTLPRLLPRLIGSRSTQSDCVADPSSMKFGMMAPFSGGPGGGGCEGGGCLGAGNHLQCRKEQDRLKFLERVGCAVYDPDD